MNTISAVVEADASGNLYLPLPKAWSGRSVRVKAELEPFKTADGSTKLDANHHLKGFGCLHGKIELSPDFDEPLEDFKE